MHIFSKKNKNNSEAAYYFGEYDETPLAPFSVSIATFEESFNGEEKHYHTQNQKVYITINGTAILNVNENKIELTPEQMVQVEPNEIHFIERVTEGPFTFVVVTSSKVNDKVVVSE